MDSIARLVGVNESDDVDVAIVGAGVAGLATAIALLKVDSKLKVKAPPEGQKYGGVCRLEPNALRAAEAIDKQLLQQLEKNGTRLRQTVLHDVDGTEISRFDGKSDHQAPHESSTILIGWYEMERILLHHLAADVVQYGCTFLSYGDNANEDGVTVQLDGQSESVRARFLIGADGSWSRVRQQCVEDGTPQFSGTVRWMGRLSGDEVSTTPMEDNCWWMRPGQSFMTHPLHDGCGDVAWEGVADDSSMRDMGFCFDHDTNQVVPLEGPDQQLPWAHKVGQIFRGFPVAVQDTISNSYPDSVVEMPVFTRRPAEMPPAMGRGHVVILGQAAHPIHMDGQEESQALEDAAELGAAVMSFGMTKEALRRFEQRRMPRWRHVMQVTMAQTACTTSGMGMRQAFLDCAADLHHQSFNPLCNVRRTKLKDVVRWAWVVTQVAVPLAAMVALTPDMRAPLMRALRRPGRKVQKATEKLKDIGEHVGHAMLSVVKDKAVDPVVEGTVQAVTPPATEAGWRLIRSRIAKMLGAF